MEDQRNVGEGESDFEDAEEEVNIAVIPVKEHSKPECIEAKKELEVFNKFGAYVETQDRGQERLSSRWVLTDKSTNEEKRVKARLVCRGFEENVDVQRDSPTCSKETLHILLALASTKGWRIKSADVKNAYLQGEKLEREVWMEPPIERKKENVIWKL